MSANMIAAVIITVVSCIVVVLAVLLLSSGVLQRLKKEVFRYIKVYNKYMEEATSSEEKEDVIAVTQKNEETFGLPKDPAIPFIAKNVPTQQKDFFADYLKIRNAFRGSAASALRKLPACSEQELALGTCVDEILQKLSFENVYKISCLQAEKQLEVLKAIFTEHEQEILEHYLAESVSVFSVTEFYCYLQGKSKELDQTVYLYSGYPEGLGIQATSEKLIICKDENLCEGFQIIQGNRLYDYGVRSSEMSL